MKSFVIFAIVVTIIYVIYYTVIIVQDLYGKPKDEKSQGESFDVSDMTDEEESIAVSESDGGFSVGDNQYETAYEEKQTVEGKKRKQTVRVTRRYPFSEIKYTKEYLDFK